MKKTYLALVLGVFALTAQGVSATQDGIEARARHFAGHLEEARARGFAADLLAAKSPFVADAIDALKAADRVKFTDLSIVGVVGGAAADPSGLVVDVDVDVAARPVDTVEKARRALVAKIGFVHSPTSDDDADENTVAARLTRGVAAFGKGEFPDLDPLPADASLEQVHERFALLMGELMGEFDGLGRPSGHADYQKDAKGLNPGEPGYDEAARGPMSPLDVLARFILKARATGGMPRRAVTFVDVVTNGGVFGDDGLLSKVASFCRLS